MKMGHQQQRRQQRFSAPAHDASLCPPSRSLGGRVVKLGALDDDQVRWGVHPPCQRRRRHQHLGCTRARVHTSARMRQANAHLRVHTPRTTRLAKVTCERGCYAPTLQATPSPQVAQRRGGGGRLGFPCIWQLCQLVALQIQCCEGRVPCHPPRHGACMEGVRVAGTGDVGQAVGQAAARPGRGGGSRTVSWQAPSILTQQGPPRTDP